MSRSANKPDCVILLHGLARSSLSMQVMEYALTRQGYCVININYPSRHLPIAELASIAIEDGLHKCHEKNAKTIHFVTHSLGGILVRQYTQQQTIPGLKRVVMLGPPNQGSEVVDKLKHLPGYRLVHGPAGHELGTADNDLPKKLGPVNFELGVIAGRKSLNPLLSSLLSGEDDGKVSVESTKIDGMKDFITLPITHTFMMLNRETIRQTIYFLQHGHFDHST
ncbi:MAG: alpha/beta hydrolase [Gammaproteobacteria bacterium]|nr:alpha/beta hydrolase [Gammaproteobacteria bacterium]